VSPDDEGVDAMQNPSCPRCHERLTPSGLTPNLLACDRCHDEFAPLEARELPLLVRSEGGGRQAAGTVALSAEFREHHHPGRLLGTGTFGSVFEGHASSTQRREAIRFMPAPADQAALEALLARHRKLQGLHHAGLVEVQEAGETAGHPFVVMDLMEGGSLRSLLAHRGALTVSRAVAIVLQCLSALGKLHSVGICHGDLRPENILFDGQERPHLTDARVQVPVIERPAGTFMRSWQYYAPEQLAGEPAGPGADIYALGLIFCEMLTGQEPAPAGAASAPTPEQLVRNLPAAAPDRLRDLILRMLSARPEDRKAATVDLDYILLKALHDERSPMKDPRRMTSLTNTRNRVGGRVRSDPSRDIMRRSLSRWALGIGFLLLGTLLLVAPAFYTPRSGGLPPRTGLKAMVP
jgi:serine/threonine protein kinase